MCKQYIQRGATTVRMRLSTRGFAYLQDGQQSHTPHHDCKYNQFMVQTCRRRHKILQKEHS